MQLLSFQGFLGLMGVGAMGDNYFSSTGAGWFKSATPEYGSRTGMRMVVNARYSPFDPDFARAGISLSVVAAVERQFVATVGTPRVLLTVSVYGAVGDFALQAVSAEAGVFEVSDAGVVRVTGSGTIGEVAVTVRATDATGNWDEVVARVSFVGPLAFPAGRVTKRIAIGYVGAVFEAPTAMGGGDGGYSYTVVTPAYKSDGTAVAMSLDGRTLIMGGDGLMAGERLTASVVVTDAAGEKATMTLVLEAGTVGTTVGLSVWFVSLRVDNRDLAVASVAATGFPSVTMRLVEGEGGLFGGGGWGAVGEDVAVGWGGCGGGGGGRECGAGGVPGFSGDAYGDLGAGVGGGAAAGALCGRRGGGQHREGGCLVFGRRGQLGTVVRRLFCSSGGDCFARESCFARGI